MKGKWKSKLLAFVMAIAMVGTLLPSTALTAFATESGTEDVTVSSDNTETDVTVDDTDPGDAQNNSDSEKSSTVVESSEGTGSSTSASETKDVSDSTGTDNSVKSSSTISATGLNYKVSVTYDSDAGLPDGTSIEMSEYSKSSSTFTKRYNEMAEYSDLEEDEDYTDDARLFAISLKSGGKTVEPNSNVSVTITYPGISNKDGDIGYAIFHYTDNGIEMPAVTSSNEGDEQSVTFTVGSFSDFMVITQDYGLTTAAVSAATRMGYFTFWYGNLSSGTKMTDENGNTTGYSFNDGKIKINYISGTNPVNYEGVNSLKLGSVGNGSGNISVEYDETSGNYLVLLDVTNYAEYNNSISSSSFRDNEDCSNSEVSSRVWDTQFDEAVSGADGTTFTGGSFTFSNVGTVDGKSVSLTVEVNSVKLYGSHAVAYAERYDGTTNTTAKVAVKQDSDNKYKICIGYIYGNKFYFGQNYVDDDIASLNKRYTTDFWTYPCLQDVDATITVNGVVKSQQFLQVQSDIDIYYSSEEQSDISKKNGINMSDVTGSSGDDSSNPAGWHFGFFAETFEMKSGFSGNYYIYSQDHDSITVNDSTVIAQATSYGNMSGSESYEYGGIYAETSGNSWDVGYSTGWCSSQVEVYSYDYNVLVTKVQDTNKNANDYDNTLNGAEFRLYRYATEEQDGEEVQVKQYYSYNNGTVSWVTDGKDAETFTTADTTISTNNTYNGSFLINDLLAGTYYLEEVAAPTGYGVLDPDVCFTVTALGAVEVDESEERAVSGTYTLSDGTTTSSLRLVIEEPPAINILLNKAEYVEGEDELQTVTDASFMLYRTTKNGVEGKYFYKVDESGQVSWTDDGDSNNASVITTESDGKISINNLTVGTYYLVEIGDNPEDDDYISDGEWEIVVTQDESTKALSYTVTSLEGEKYLEEDENVESLYDESSNPVAKYTLVNYQEPGLEKVITNPNDSDTSTNNPSLKDDGTAKASSYNVGDDIEYQVTIPNIPDYSGDYPLFELTDTLAAGLSYNGDMEIDVQRSGHKNPVDLTEGTDYTIDYDEETNVISINFVVNEKYTLNDYAEETLILTYSAKLTENANYNAEYNENDVELTYTINSVINPNGSVEGYDNPTETLEDKTFTYTFDIDGATFGGYTSNGYTNGEGSTSITWRVITKTGETEYYKELDEDSEYTTDDEVVNEIALEGAKFTLYTDENCTKVYTNGTEDSKNYFDGTVTSDEQGQLQILGLAAGTYYLKETEAPEGYQMNTHVYKIVIETTYKKYDVVDEDKNITYSYYLLDTWSITIDGENTSTFTVYYEEDTASKADFDSEEGDTNGKDTIGWDSTGWYVDKDDAGNEIWVKFDVTETKISNRNPELEKVITNPDKDDTTSDNLSLDDDGNAKGSSYSIGDTIEYQVTITGIPKYDGDYPYYTVTDTLDKGLTYVDKSLTVTAYTSDENDSGTELVSGTDYTLSYNKLNRIITLNFVVDGSYTLNDYWQGHLVLTYDVTLGDDANVNAEKNDNDVVLEYAFDDTSDNNGGDNHGTLEDQTHAYTFDIDGAALGQYTENGNDMDGSDSVSWRIITKIDEGDIKTESSDSSGETEQSGGLVNEDPLSGATFTLYTKNPDELDEGENAKDYIYTNDVFNGTVTSDSEGELQINGLEAGTYYLKETVPPEGYVEFVDVLTIKITTKYDEDGLLQEWKVVISDGDEVLGTSTFTIVYTEADREKLEDYTEDGSRTSTDDGTLNDWHSTGWYEVTDDEGNTYWVYYDVNETEIPNDTEPDPELTKYITDPNENNETNATLTDEGYAKDSSFDVGDEVDYEVTVADIPHYSGSYPYFTLTDTLGEGLTYEEGTMVITVVDEDGDPVLDEDGEKVTLTEGIDYTLTINPVTETGSDEEGSGEDESSGSGEELTTIDEEAGSENDDNTEDDSSEGSSTNEVLLINFVVDGEYTLNDYAHDTLVLDYTALLNENAHYDLYYNENDIVLDYTTNSWSMTSLLWYNLGEEEDQTYTYTFDIDGAAIGTYVGDGYSNGGGSTSFDWRIITKTGEDVEYYPGDEENSNHTEEDEVVNEQALAGAQFTLYIDQECTIPYTNGNVGDEDHFDGNVESDTYGELLIRGLAAGTYYLKETKAPDGYLSNSHVYKIVIAAVYDDNVDEDGVPTPGLAGWNVTIDDKNTSSFTVYYTLADAEDAGYDGKENDDQVDTNEGWISDGWQIIYNEDGSILGYIKYDVDETDVVNWEPDVDKEITDPNEADNESNNPSMNENGDVKGSSFSVGDTVKYSVTVSGIPGYVGDYPYYTVTDTLSDGLTYDEDTGVTVTAYPYADAEDADAEDADTEDADTEDADIVEDTDTGDNSVEDSSTEGTVLTEGTDYTLTVDGQVITLDFVVDGSSDNGYTLNAYEGGYLIIEYNAILNDEATYNAEANNNDVVLDFVYDSSYEIDYGMNHDTREDKTYSYTFDIDGAALGVYTGNGWTNGGGSDSETWRVITKVGTIDYYDDYGDDSTYTEDDKVVNSKALEGAVFTLYSDPKGLEVYTNDVFGGTATSDAQGEIQIKGLPAGTYYLKETVAPEGYTRNAHMFKIEIGTTYNEDGTLDTWSITIDDTATSTFQVYNTEEAADDAGYTEGDETSGSGWDSTGWTAVEDEDGNILYWVQYNVTETEITDRNEPGPDVDKVITDPNDDDTGNNNYSVDSDGNVKGSSFDVGDEVDYLVNIYDLPYYDGEYPYFTVTDTLAEGLSYIEENGMTVTAYNFGSTDGTELVEGTDYTLTVDGQTISLDFVVDGYTSAEGNSYTLNDYAEGYLTLEYSAMLTENASYNAIYNDNDVIVEYVIDSTYTSDSGENRGAIEDKTYSYTFDIDGAAFGEGLAGSGSETWRIITKTGEDEYTGKGDTDGQVHPYALEGAEFTLYTDKNCKHVYTNDVFGGTVTSDAQGELQIKGLSTGTYYLKETKAPSGYLLADDVHVIRISGTYAIDGLLTSWSVYIDGVETSHFDVLYDADITDASSDVTTDKNGKVTLTGFTPVTDDEGNVLYWVQYNVGEYTIDNEKVPTGGSISGKLPQTGMLLWPIIILAAFGCGLIGTGLKLSGGKKKNRKHAA